MRHTRTLRSPLRLAAAAGSTVAAVACGGGDAPQRAPRAAPVSGDAGVVAEATVKRGSTVLVALEGQAAVAFVRDRPWRLVRRTKVAAGPHNLAADPQGLAAAVTSPPSDRVTIMEPDGRVRLVVPVGGGPHDVRFTRDGRALWVTVERGRRLVQIGVRTGRVLRSVPVGAQPHDLAISVDGARMWITMDGSATLQERSVRNGRLLAIRRPGGAPHDVGFAPGGREAWLSNWGSGALTVASSRSGRRAGRVTAGTEPHHFAFGRGTVWVTDNGGGALVRIARRTRRVLSRTAVGRAPHHVAVADGSALVAVNGSGRLVVVSRRGRVAASVRVGRRPHGIAAIAATNAARPAASAGDRR